jgi:hypothetical protein
MYNRKFYFDEDGHLIMEDHGLDMSIEYTSFDKDDIDKIQKCILEYEENID